MTTTDRDRQIGDALAELRGARSQQQLADLMRARGHKWSQTTVWHVENGSRALRLAEAVEVAQLLDIELVDLLEPASGIRSATRLREATDRVRQTRAQLEATQHEVKVLEVKLSEALQVLHMVMGDVMPNSAQSVARAFEEAGRVIARLEEDGQ